MTEIWKDIPGYEGRYQASSTGRIRSLGARARVLKHTDLQGYDRVGAGKGNSQLVHRLIALAFVSNPNNKPHINHIDGNKKNNRIENLEWVTRSENIQHAFRTGLRVPPNNVGINHSQSILNEEQVVDIRNLRRHDGYNYREISEMYGVTAGNIAAICTRRSWKHVK